MRNWIFILKSCCAWGITLHAGPDPVQSKLVRYYTLPPRILLNICSTGINSSSWEPEKTCCPWTLLPQQHQQEILQTKSQKMRSQESFHHMMSETSEQLCFRSVFVCVSVPSETSLHLHWCSYIHLKLLFGCSAGSELACFYYMLIFTENEDLPLCLWTSELLKYVKFYFAGMLNLSFKKDCSYSQLLFLTVSHPVCLLQNRKQSISSSWYCVRSVHLEVVSSNLHIKTGNLLGNTLNYVIVNLGIL